MTVHLIIFSELTSLINLETMDLSTKCLNPVEMNMMDKSDIKLEIKTNENNVMYMCPVDNNTNDTEEPARQSYLSNKNKVKQNQQNTEAEQKINGYGVNLTNRDSVTQEEIDDYGEKCNDQKEIKPVPQFSDETQSSHTEKGKLSNILINTTKKMKKLTGKIKIVKGCVKAKENKKKLTARTGSKILSERNKRISSNSVTPKWTVKTGHENQKGHKNLSDDNNVLKKSIREFTCEQCNKTFSSQYNLNRHYKSVHLKMKQKRKGTKKYFCKQEGCDKVFSNGSNYKKHYDTVHLNIRRHLCEICSFMFKTKWALKTHLNTLHEKDQQKFRIFECKLCQKRFTSKGKLKLHETVHTDLKPFKCSYEDCGKSFRLVMTGDLW